MGNRLGLGWNRIFIYFLWNRLVGDEANYIVYPKNVPPVADFTASATSNCTNGTIQFIDASYNSPTSWSWNFGDGGTSNLENPSHTYAANGTYTVSLTAFNVNGNSPPYTQTNYITIDIPPDPTVTGASGVGPCSLILTASGTDSLNWYSAPTGGTLLHTGTSFKTPILTTTTTYYVQDEVVQPVLSAGMADTTINGFYCGSAGDDIGLICNVLTDITINSVTIYAATTNSKCIWLKNSSGTTLDLVVTNLAGKQKINLNFNVPAGTGYQLVKTLDCNLWMDTSGASYPYTAPGLISITGNDKKNQAYYYFFYNLQVQAPSCFSAMVPVIAKISSTGINELSEGNFDIYPNPNTGSFDIKLNDLNVQYATIGITNMLGQMLMEKKVMNNNALFHVDAPDLQPGMYYAIIHTETGVAVKKFVIE